MYAKFGVLLVRVVTRFLRYNGYLNFMKYYIRGGGGSIFNENPFITPSTNALEFYAICQTKDQGVSVIMVQETLFYLFKFIKLRTF